jgi:hypothetical protein
LRNVWQADSHWLDEIKSVYLNMLTAKGLAAIPQTGDLPKITFTQQWALTHDH